MRSNAGLNERYVPVIPDEFKIYDSYDIDPQWQIRFTIAWTSVLAFTTVLSAPYIYKVLRKGQYFRALSINYHDGGYETTRGDVPATTTQPNELDEKGASRGSRTSSLGRILAYGQAIYQSIALRSLPALPTRKGRRTYWSLHIGHLTTIALYLTLSILCFTLGAQLLQNSNRPGFIALSQLPLIILLSLKSPLPLPLFLPTLSYHQYNFLHRYAGRTLFLLVTVHGALWLNQFRTTGQTDQIWSDKSQRGMIAYGLMCGIVLTSLKPFRRRWYSIFFAAHVVMFVGFFAALSYHTPHAAKWVYPCVAIYGYDLTVRLLRYRIKDAIILPIDEHTTMIHIQDCSSGWKPTQHVFLRVLRGSGVFESHPFTITNAPQLNSPSSTSTSPSSTRGRGITLYAKASGDWTKRLHALAGDLSLEVGEDTSEREAFLARDKSANDKDAMDQCEGMSKWGNDHPGKEVKIILDGPYGGLKLDLEDLSRVICIAGGSGITFALGVLEMALLACAPRGMLRGVDLVWAVRDQGSVRTFAPTLTYLRRLAQRTGLAVNIHIYLSSASSSTSAHDPSHAALLASLPPSSEILSGRPDLSSTIQNAVRDTRQALDFVDAKRRGLAVVACGPEGLVVDARNAVAAIPIRENVAIGGVSFHGECYTL